MGILDPKPPTRTELSSTYATKAEMANSSAVPLTMFPLDAITLGGDSTSTNWGSTLATLTGKSVQSVGHGGQTSAQIAARSGAVRAKVTVSGGTIPASGPVTITADVNIIAGASNFARTGVLAGVYGTWSYDGTTQTFTRMLAGAATPCPPNTEFYCTEEQYNNRILVYSVGRNDPYTLTAQYTADMLAAIRGRQESRVKRVLFLSILPNSSETNGTADRAKLDAKNAACAATLGESWADFATWIRTDEAFQAAEVTKTAQDITDISNGITPSSLRSDTLHLNSAGNKAQAWYAARQLFLRGWTTANPPLPNPAYDPGVSGFTHRYAPSLMSEADGTTISTLNDIVGTHNLTNGGAGTRTVKVDATAGIKYLEVKGTGSAAISAPAGTALSGPITVAMVVRMASAPNSAARVGPYQFYKAANGWAGFYDATGGTKAVDVSADAGWHLITGTLNGTSTEWDYDGVVKGAGGILGTSTPAVTSVGGNSTDVATDLAELIIWPTALTTAQRATIRTNMKAQYPSLP